MFNATLSPDSHDRCTNRVSHVKVLKLFISDGPGSLSEPQDTPYEMPNEMFLLINQTTKQTWVTI